MIVENKITRDRHAQFAFNILYQCTNSKKNHTFATTQRNKTASVNNPMWLVTSELVNPRGGRNHDAYTHICICSESTNMTALFLSPARVLECYNAQTNRQ